MSIRTQEQLKAMFQQSRARKQKEREQHKKEKQQQYRDLCKEADRLLKEAIQDEKRKRIEQLQALTKKTSQKQRKCTVTEFYISNNRYIDKDNDWIHYYQTREELMAAEERGEGKINWSKFDQLVDKVRKELGL